MTAQPPQDPQGEQPPQPPTPGDPHEPSERIIDTSSGRPDGLNKCPRCGSTEIQYSLTAKALVCS